MDIFKKLNRHHLFTFPFILVPLLVTHRFQDPTLLIKRSGVFFLFVIIVLILAIFKRDKNTISNTNLKWLTGIGTFILVLAVISNYNSINPSESYWELIYLLGWITIYACFMTFATTETIKYIIVTSSFIGAMLSLLLFNDVYNWISISLPSKGFMSATFGFRNYFGQYLCFSIPAAVISLFMLKLDKSKLCMLICCILNIGGLVLTRTRAAWLGVFISLLIFTILNRSIIQWYIQILKRKKRYLIIFSMAFLIIIYFMNISITSPWSQSQIPPNKNTFWKTINTLSSLKTEQGWGNRLDMYKSTIGIIKDFPLLGVGLSNWKLLYPKYSNNKTYTDNIKPWQIKPFAKITQRPHNDFLWLLSEIGFTGMIFIVGFLIYHLRLLLMALKRGEKSDEDRYVFMFCLISLIAIGIESMLDFPLQRTMPNLYFWSIMGFIASTNTHNKDKRKYQYPLPMVLTIILSIVSVFSYFDIKSNIYSQDAKYYNSKRMPKELYASSAIALSYYRNLDNAGTPIYYYMGIAKHQLGDRNAAKLYFQNALQLAPFHIGALTNYMIVLGELGELTSAHKIMQIIQHVYPKMAKPRLDMAKFYLREGKNDKAKEILMKLKINKLNDSKNTREKLLLLIEE